MVVEHWLYFRNPGKSGGDFQVYEFDIGELISILKKQAERNPQAQYFNVDILKYQVRI